MIIEGAFKLIDAVCVPLCNIDNIADIVIEKNIVYDVSDPKTCKLDLYYKEEEGKEKYPVILNIHGGAFVAGDKKYRKSISKDFASDGSLVVTINYGLAPKYPFPTFIFQAVSALKWIFNSENALKYKMDLDNVFVMGDSAGGFIAAYLGVISSSPEVRKRFGIEDWNMRIKGEILYCGVYNAENLIERKMMMNLQYTVGSKMLNYPKKDLKELEQRQKYEYYDVINLKNFINKDFPSTFITYTDNDFLCPMQGQEFHKHLSEVGIKTNHHHSTDKGDVHCYQAFRNRESAQLVIQMTKDFIKELSSE